MAITIKQRIKEKKQLEKDAAELAARYGKTGDYRQAANWYRAAEKHRWVWEELKEFSR